MATAPTNEAVSFGRRITDLADEKPDAIAVIFAPQEGDDVAITWRQLDERSTQIARLLAERGATADALVAIALKNSPEHVYSAIAAWKVGAGVLPVRSDLPQWERDRLLETAGVGLVVGDLEELEVPRVTLAEIKATVDRPTEPLPDVVPKRAIAIASSGSTGRPKVIVREMPGAAVPNANAPMTAAYVDLPDEVPQLIPAPLYHTNGFQIAHGHLFSGQTIILMERFEAARALDLIEQYRIVCFTAVPTMLGRMAHVEGVEKRDLSSLAFVMYGGAPCPEWIIEAWFELIGPEKFIFTYGSSEATGLAVMSGTEWLTHRGASGRGFRTLIRILDDEGNELPNGEVGEIFMLMPDTPGPPFEYVGAAPPKRTPDGYTSIGDLGRLDDDGYIYIADRRVDMIVSGGANIFPAEVEAALSENEKIADVVVVGLPDPEWGRRVHAIVEPADPANPPTSEELDAHARARLAAYKVPKGYEIVDKLPRTEAGKINRGKLTAERETAEAPDAARS